MGRIVCLSAHLGQKLPGFAFTGIPRSKHLGPHTMNNVNQLNKVFECKIPIIDFKKVAISLTIKIYYQYI